MHLHWNVDDQKNNSGTECKMQQTSTHVSIECQGTTCDHLTSMNYETIDEDSIHLVKPLPR